MSKQVELNESFFLERPNKILATCRSLMPIMNKLHGVNFSERFWITILSEYVKTCVNRFHYFSEPCTSYFIPPLPINGWHPITRKQAIELRFKTLYKDFAFKGTLVNLITAMKSSKKISFGPRGKEFEVYGLSKYVESVSLPLWIGDTNKRSQLNNLAKKEVNIFFKNVLLQMPLYYVEGFSSSLNKIPKLEHPEQYEFHFEHGDSFFMELLVAYYVEQGARAIMYQLGAFIGEVNYLTINPIMHAKIDEHRTYGWKISQKDIPHFAYRLEEFQQKVQSYNDDEIYDILIVYNDNIVQEEIFTRYKFRSKYFFENFKSATENKILLRPRGKSKKIDSSKDLVVMNPPNNCKIDKGMMPLAKLVKQSKLVIHWEVPATNFLECIYIDKPVIGIIQNIDPTEIIIPHYNNLKRLNILHDEVYSMVDHLNSVDINEWWAKVKIDPDYILFKKTFANKPPIRMLNK
jgi:hypothetical protein